MSFHTSLPTYVELADWPRVPTTGEPESYFCPNKDCDHRTNHPTRLCPVCAPNPKKVA